MDDLNKLVEGITNEGLATFVQKASDAYLELEQTIRPLPEKVTEQWSAALRSIIESQAR